jgi:16S rRNA processing protein RimM
MPDQASVILAKVGAPHGVRGELRVKSYTEDPLALRSYGPLAAPDGRSFAIERMRAAGDMLVVKFRGVDDRDAAARLNGVLLGVPRSALPEPDAEEFYHADLIGLAAFTAEGAPYGTVAAVFNHGAGDMLDIARPEGEHGPSRLVPFTRAAVPVIDLPAGRLTIVPPAETEAREEDATESEAP